MSQNVNEIKHHISAVKQTRKITNAMRLVASARMKSVMQRVEYNKNYFNRVQSTMKHIILSSPDIEHPYFIKRDGERRTFIVIAGDKGMAGSYNANILNFAEKEIAAHPENNLITVGMIANDHFRQKHKSADIEMISAVQDPSLDNARELAFDIIEIFEQNLTDEVDIIYTSFYGETKHQPVIHRLLPIDLSYYDTPVSTLPSDIMYLPNPSEVFWRLVPQYLIGIIYDQLVQSYAAEHFARMNAMESATQNADELLKKLSIQYNMARQAAITNEIAEITSACEALRNH